MILLIGISNFGNIHWRAAVHCRSNNHRGVGGIYNLCQYAYLASGCSWLDYFYRSKAEASQVRINAFLKNNPKLLTVHEKNFPKVLARALKMYTSPIPKLKLLPYLQ